MQPILPHSGFAIITSLIDPTWSLAEARQCSAREAREREIERYTPVTWNKTMKVTKEVLPLRRTQYEEVKELTDHPMFDMDIIDKNYAEKNFGAMLRNRMNKAEEKYEADYQEKLALKN